MTKIHWPHKYMGRTNTRIGLNINSWSINDHSLCIKLCYEFCILLHYIFDTHYFLVSDALEYIIQWTSSSPNFKRARLFIEHELKNYILTFHFFTIFGVFWPSNQSYWWSSMNAFSDSLHEAYFSLFILEKNLGSLQKMLHKHLQYSCPISFQFVW